MQIFRRRQQRLHEEIVAQKLVGDLMWGMEAIQSAIACGDAILPFLRKKSKDFTDLNIRNAEWIAETLAGIRTEQSAAILRELYDREAEEARLVASVGLAAHDALPEPVTEDCFLVRTVRADAERRNMHLAILALGLTRNEAALPCLLDLLRQRDVDYWLHVFACEAVGRIGSSSAIPTLKECLSSPNYFALPDAFRVLIALGSREAIPLAIARVSLDLKRYNSGFIVNELAKVTGVDFGYDQRKWEKWWLEAESRWEIPSRFRLPWDEQEKRY